MKQVVGMFLFVVGGVFYMLSLGLSLLQEQASSAVFLILGIGLILLSTLAFLYDEETTDGI